MCELTDNLNDYSVCVKGYQLGKTRPVFGSDDETSENVQKVLPQSCELVSESDLGVSQSESPQDLEDWLDEILDD